MSLNLPFYIARRYFLSRKKKNFINVISIFSMVEVAVGTMALVVVLSVFNGLEDLIRSLYNTFDPQVKVSSYKGKSFELTDSLYRVVSQTEGVALITEVIEDNVLLKYKEDQMVVKMKGVSENFIKDHRIDSMIVDGELILKKGDENRAILGRGVQAILTVPLHNEIFPLQLWYPKKKKISSLNPDQIFNREIITAGAIFAIEKQYDDNYIFVPLDVAQRLLHYTTRRTSLEIKVKEGFDINQVRNELRKRLGSNFEVLNSDEQHASLLRAVKIEKLFVYITFSIILALASFNIFFSLTMLAIEKKKDVAILFSMGASSSFIKKLFFTEGLIIASTGALTGLFLGMMLCLAQQEFGFVSMGMESSLVEAYPVKMHVMDFVTTGLTILVITFLASLRPALSASKVSIKENI